MRTLNRSTVVGVFGNRTNAERAVEELRRAGFAADQIRVGLREGRLNDTAEPVPAADPKAGAVAAVGATAGGVVGIVVGLVAAVSFMPAIGAVLAWVVAGAVVGAIVGGSGAAVVGPGILKEEARLYKEQLQVGGTIITADVGTRLAEARMILRRNEANDGTRGEPGDDS